MIRDKEIPPPSASELSDLFKKQEPLCEELKSYVVEDAFMYVVHPLIMSVPHSEQMNAYVNRQFQYRKRLSESLLSKGEYEEYVWLHEKPYMLDAFIKVCNSLDDKTYWGMLNTIWTTIENNWQNKKTWKLLFSPKNKRYVSRHFFMDKKETDVFNSLPNKIEIYRGCTKRNEDGFSYTLEYDTAQWFSKRFKNDGYVISKTIDKDDAFAFCSQEKEIIYIPKK